MRKQRQKLVKELAQGLTARKLRSILELGTLDLVNALSH